jgi:hypothetical protein
MHFLQELAIVSKKSFSYGIVLHGLCFDDANLSCFEIQYSVSPGFSGFR